MPSRASFLSASRNQIATAPEYLESFKTIFWQTLIYVGAGGLCSHVHHGAERISAVEDPHGDTLQQRMRNDYHFFYLFFYLFFGNLPMRMASGVISTNSPSMTYL